MRTQVAIIGGGPSGLILSQLLMRAGIDTVVLERQTREHVLGRIRAGVLERGAVELLRRAGVGERLDAEGIVHEGTNLSTVNGMFRVDFKARVGEVVTVYGQTEVTRDLYAAQDALGATIIDEAADVALHDLETEAPWVSWRKDGSSSGWMRTISPAATASTARAGRRSRATGAPNTSASIRSAGWACCRAPVRRPRN
jgi:p-hydroxybenzoate 3-monooxygenase